MQQRNEYRVIINATWTGDTQLTRKDNDAIILERTEEGIVYFWPLFPLQCNAEDLVAGNQDLEDYRIDGFWATPEPWMYFTRMDDVLNVINRRKPSFNTLDLGYLQSIREARAKALVMLSLVS